MQAGDVPSEMNTGSFQGEHHTSIERHARMKWFFAIMSLVIFAVFAGFVYILHDTGLFQGFPSDGFDLAMGCLLLAALGVVGWLGASLGNEAFIRFTSEAIQETLTVMTVEHREETIPVVHSSGKVSWVQMIDMHYTDITTEEYPDQSFTASGNYDWDPGSRVTITFYVRNGKKVRYDF